MQLYRLNSLNRIYAVHGEEVFAYLAPRGEWLRLEQATAQSVRKLLTLVGNNFKPRGL